MTIPTNITDDWLRNECGNLKSEPDLPRQHLPLRVVLAYLLRVCAVISLLSCPSQNFRMSSSTPDLAMIEDRKRRNACAAFPGSLIPSFFIEGVRCRLRKFR